MWIELEWGGSESKEISSIVDKGKGKEIAAGYYIVDGGCFYKNMNYLFLQKTFLAAHRKF